jgi:hypothetical protein
MGGPLSVGLGLGLTAYEATEVIDAFEAAADRDEIPSAWALPLAQGAMYCRRHGEEWRPCKACRAASAAIIEHIP